MKAAAEDEPLAVVDALVSLSTVDLPFSDLYLDRAETLLGEMLNREGYLVLCRERDNLSGLAKELRQRAERGDWQGVHALAQSGTGCRQRSADHEHLLALGDAVYGPRVLRADATALALNGIMVGPRSDLARVRDESAARLRFVLARDQERADFYRVRLAHLDDLVLDGDEPPGGLLNVAGLQQRILDAADHGDFEQVDRLSAAILEATSQHEPGPLRVARVLERPARTIAAGFSDTTVARARALGLTPVTLDADEALNSYMSGTSDACLTRAFPAPLSNGLRETLDLLVGHPFVTSAGSRYLPDFGAETLLVETFAETELDTRTGLLDALELRRRRGLSRLAIEDAVRSRTTRVCAELGLDPARYTVIPIPFDAYLRLAPRYDWGRQQLWTHFDGYQLSRDLHLRALVGGDAHYGGPEDLCSVARDYETEHLMARFAAVDRQRLMGPRTAA